MTYENTISEKIIKLGTRGSDLALWQAKSVASQLGVDTETCIIQTTGDRFMDFQLQSQPMPGFFTKEIETQLLAGEIDLAVHSLKDVPTQIHPNLILAAYLPRAAANDLLLIHPDWYDPKAIVPLKSGCKVGASSLRRQALLRLYAPQVRLTMLRGNVPSRIEKCKSGEYGAIVLAQAGVERLELQVSPLLAYQLNPKIWVPAPGQGVIVVQIRRYHRELIELVKKMDDSFTRESVIIERQLLANFQGGSFTAVGVYVLPVADKWDVYIGLAQPDKGWGQIFLSQQTSAQISQIKPATIGAFVPFPVEKKESLCTSIPL